MRFQKFHLRTVTLAAIAGATLLSSRTAFGYVDLAPTLAKVINDSQRVSVVEIVSIDRTKNRITLKEVKGLKGQMGTDVMIHEVSAGESGVVPRPILQWAEPGAQAVMFISNQMGIVCMGRGWYQVQSLSARGWKLGMERPDLPLAYYGSVSRLIEGISLMVAGKDALLTTVPHGAEEGASFDLAFNRATLPGSVKVQRIRANLRMPDVVMSVSASSTFLLGQGEVDPAELPTLIAKLRSDQPNVRAESAEDIGSLEKKAITAKDNLRSLLEDKSPRVRMAAAAAILRIAGDDTAALDVLSKGLQSDDVAARRAAVGSVRFAGKPAGALTEKLVTLLKDSDEATRVGALQAISVLGPAAAKAAPAVKELLADPQIAIDAADALGRIGPAARPVPELMVKMLESPEPNVRWAAVRGMSQIGGDEAKPAVDFMIKTLPKSPEVDNYNMHIYLAVLGPIAKDAIPAMRAARLKNPVLPTATMWAMEPEKTFPWQMGGRGTFRGDGGDDRPDFAKFIYEAYVSELGDRLKPAAEKLAKTIMDGTAGDVPGWGYKILNCDTEGSLKIFTESLASKDLIMRERAAVALGYMGSDAAPAKPKLEEALKSAPTEKERRLLKWSLRQISTEN